MSRQTEYQRRMRAEGRCPHCGEKTDRNPKTGKPYYFCEERRKQKAVKDAVRYEKKRKVKK